MAGNEVIRGSEGRAPKEPAHVSSGGHKNLKKCIPNTEAVTLQAVGPALHSFRWPGTLPSILSPPGRCGQREDLSSPPGTANPPGGRVAGFRECPGLQEPIPSSLKLQVVSSLWHLLGILHHQLHFLADSAFCCLKMGKMQLVRTMIPGLS